MVTVPLTVPGGLLYPIKEPYLRKEDPILHPLKLMAIDLDAMTDHDAANRMAWLYRDRWLDHYAILGMLSWVPLIRRHLEYLDELVEAERIWFLAVREDLWRLRREEGTQRQMAAVESIGDGLVRCFSVWL